MAKKVVASTALAKYDERFKAMAAQAKTAVSAVGAGGNFISFKGGVMTYKGARIPEDTLRAVIIDAIPVNEEYTSAFDPEGFSSPDCFAFGRVFGTGELVKPKDMAPNPADVAAPRNATCEGCHSHEWGSADKGRGKACKETQRLAVLAESDLENIEAGEVAYIKLPVTSIKNWAGYVRNLDDVYHRPPIAFLTEIKLVKVTDGSLPGWNVEFRLIQQIEDAEAFEALFERYDEVTKAIAFPWQKTGDNGAAKPAPRAARTSARVNRQPPPAPVPVRGGKTARPRF